MNYLDVAHSVPLSTVDKLVVLAPSLYRLSYKFQPYDLVIIDESESVFEDLFSGLCTGPKFEHQMEVLMMLIKSSSKILMLDGFLSDCSLSVCCNFAENLDDIRIILGDFRVNRGTLWTVHPGLK